MLLPSDVARLVLGYLQQEKLASTCKSFIAESSNLKEYAEHHTDDGTIPGCLLSLFGKNLTTILNEYVTMKAKENDAEIPFMMSSLWKKLDLTLSQIRCMQESAAFQTHQRARTRRGINDRLRQKMLTSPPAVSSSSVLHSVAPQTSTPIVATQYILHPIISSGASQSVNTLTFNGQSTTQSSTPANQSLAEASQASCTAPVQKKLSTAATSSPMRRKPDAQRRRRMAASAAADKDTGLDPDTIQGIIDDDFPQLVIENAREKILSNKCLQEKLAENINKILASDPATQTTKQGDGAPPDDTSIDEILGLQGGEIHMSEEAIHDILVQTELDPEFQELYDLFACVTSKTPKNPPRDSSTQNSDTKCGVSEKGKKRDAGENAEQAANKSTSGPAERECDRPEAGTSSAEKADNGSSCQQTSVSGNPISGSRSSEGDMQSDVIFIDSSDGETVMDTSKEAQRTVTKASSPIQDTEMKDISPAGEASGDYCFVAEKVSPQVSVCEDKPLPTSTCSGGSSTVKPSETTKDSARGKSSDKPEQETDNTVTATSALLGVGLDPSTSSVLSCSSTQNEKDSQPSAVGSPLNKPCSDLTVKQGSESDSSRKDVMSQIGPVGVNHPVSHGQSNLAPEIVAYSTGIAVSSGSQAVVDSNIVTLNIITEDLPEDAEISSAIRSINNENYPTIILSPVVDAQEVKRVGSGCGEVELAVTGEQLLATSTDSLMSSVNISNGDCTVYTVSGAAATADGSIIQLVPASGSTFTPTNSLFLSSCVANNVPPKQPNIMMLSNSSHNSQKQAGLFQTPPRPAVYTVGQTISPKVSQGSTFILASPAQPMLQGVMGMFPVSLVGQSGSTFTAQPHQILHVPISKPVVPKLPLPPKSQKPLPKPSASTVKPVSNPAVDSTSRRSSSTQSRENGEKISTSETQRKPDEHSIPESRNAVIKPMETHRRVLCFDGTSSSSSSNFPATSNAKGQNKDKSDSTQNLPASTEIASCKTSASKDSKKTESSTVSKEKSFKGDVGNAPTKDQSGEKRLPSSSGESGGNKENVMQPGTEKHEAGQTEKRASSQESLNTEKCGKPTQETSRKQTSLPNILRRTPQKISSERVCVSSPLAKQAGQLLQDIQFQSPTSKQRTSGDLPIPRTPGSGFEDRMTDRPEHRRTPMSRRYNEDLGTPKPMMPPATPELPTCSPASEAGSESSVNMAAHTLMILSRASIPKSNSNTPLKDNTTQSKSSKSIAKKRRLEEADEYERRSQRKEHLSPSSLQKKKMKKRKRSPDSFPAGMDVEKFLMSLHYDE